MQPANCHTSVRQLTVSVALCTYNSEKYLRQQLDSILSQTMQVHEIVVIDDVSVDSTLSILEAYAGRHPAVFRLFRNRKNRGARKNFERLLSLCRGDVILLCDHDDCWKPDKAVRIITHFRRNPQDKVLFTNADFIDEHGHSLPSCLWDVVGFPQEVRAHVRNRDQLLQFLLKHGRIITGATMAVRKDFIHRLLPFRLMHKLWHDAWIAVVAAQYRVLNYIDEPLISYRIHSGQQVGSGYLKKIRNIMAGTDLVPELMHKELNAQCREEDLVHLVHIRRKRVRFIKRLSRFLELDKQITDNILHEKKLAEHAYTRAKPLPVRVTETFRKMFG